MKVYRHVYTVVVVDENPDPDSQLEDLEFAVQKMECIDSIVFYADEVTQHKVKTMPKGDDKEMEWLKEQIVPLLST